jgi:hypothetical protein
VAVSPLDVGAAASSGEVVVTDTLPAGVTATDAGVFSQRYSYKGPLVEHKEWDCLIAKGVDTPENSVVSCHNDATELPHITGGAGHAQSSAAFGGDLADEPAIGIEVTVAAGAPQGRQPNGIVVAGGGAPEERAVSDQLEVGGGASSFGFSGWGGWFSNANGTLDTQAGSVPYSATFHLELNNEFDPAKGGVGGEYITVGGEPRDFAVELPPGWVGNPNAVPRCTRVQLLSTSCPPDTMVGFADVETSNVSPVNEMYNMEPPPGVAAELAFPFEEVNAELYAGVRSGSDYGITTDSDNSPQKEVLSVEITLWGVPHDPSHNVWRKAQGCSEAELAPGGECNLGAHPNLKPFLRLPTSCRGPQPFAVSVNSWLDPETVGEASFLTAGASGEPAGFSACGKLPFEPGIQARPTTAAADAPSGLSFDLHVPQPEGVTAIEEEAGGETHTVGAEPALHAADLKDATITFPAGLAVNPSEANGLQACSEQEIGFLGYKELDPAGEAGVQTPQFTPEPAECPNASKIGNVEVDTPLLDHPLLGGVYLASQSENPFGSLLALYIGVYDPESGVVVKLSGRVQANEQTGQLSTVVDQSPQLPFEDFKISLFEGAQASLTTPGTCGTFTTSSLLVPWSSPEGAAATPSGSFEVTSAPGGGPCAASEAQQPNEPSFDAGTLTPAAGAYSPLVVHLGREDGTQRLGSLTVTLPGGLLARLAGVERCPQAGIETAMRRNGLGEGKLEQEHPSCPAGSEIGQARVGVGSGAPFYTTGRAYLAGPYNNAPFSVVVITPAIAGPFDLGTVVVRSGLSIDPHTAQATIRSDPFPTILDGIPLDIRSITVEATRTQFTLNPTSCDKTTVNGTVTSTQGIATSVSSPFQASGCASLAFAPHFQASTSGHASKSDGASLHLRITTTPGQANIGKVKVELPKQLPSRQVTLDKACLIGVFETNPAACPPESLVGTATALSPLLATPFTGPAYLISHGAAELPHLDIVLQSEGITIILDNKIKIKNGITTSTLETAPDAPIATFELTFPQGPHSILGTYIPENLHYDLCSQQLHMPTEITGQNDRIERQTTNINPENCPTGLTLLSKHITKRSITLTIIVPTAGQLTATGTHLTKTIKHPNQRKTITITLKTTNCNTTHTKITLTFKPTKGHKQTKTIPLHLQPPHCPKQ